MDAISHDVKSSTCRTWIVILVLVALVGVLFPPAADAVPAFARKYDVSCNACHTRHPRLNSFGQRFLENGYQMPGTEDGGSVEKSLFGGPLNGATLGEIGNYFAVRVRGDIQQASFREETEATDDVDIIMPNVVNLFFAGTATKNISFFLEGEYATQEGHGGGLIFERAFLVFSNLGGQQIANIKVGEFDPSSMYSFPTHRQQLNPIPPDAHTDDFPPEINRAPLLPLAFSAKMFGLTTGPGTVGDPTGAFNPMMAGALDTYGSGGADGFSILPFEPVFYNAPVQKGISVHGRPFGNNFLYQVGMAQNDTADDEPTTRWDSYVMLRYDILSAEYSALQISGFWYNAPGAARATLAPPPLGGDIVFSQNVLDWTRYGFAARWQYKFFDIYGTVIWDRIDDPIFGNAVVDTGTWETDAVGISLEADWLINSRWMLGVRYDQMQTGGLSRLPVPFQVVGDEEVNLDASFVGLIGKYYVRPNIGLYLRGHFNLESSAQFPANVQGGAEHPARNLESMLTVGVDMAF